jgi:catechol 2,3-dioxygenase-like lactoylglutathione lyase family enzyme
MTPTLTEPAAPRQAAPTETTTFFHLSLLVADLERSLAFYRVLFNAEPSKAYPGDYAEFEVADPPLLLALTQCPGRTPGGALNHIGLRFSSEVAVANVAKRLEAAGLSTRHEEKVACCYARQTKCWATDPDHNLWEIYVLFDDLNYNGYGGKTAPPVQPEPEPANFWEHKHGDPTPASSTFADGSVDEARLSGSFNDTLTRAQLQALLSEARRVLRPGGRVVVQGLVSAEPFPGKPDLPGLASKVRSVPVEHEPLEALRQAGFTDLYFEQNGDIKCFKVEGVEFRKIRLVGRRPAASPGAPVRAVVYKGPMAQVAGDDGTVYRRGEEVPVTAQRWEELRRGRAAAQFAFLGEATQG